MYLKNIFAIKVLQSVEFIKLTVDPHQWLILYKFI